MALHSDGIIYSTESLALSKVFELFAPAPDTMIISYGENFDALWELNNFRFDSHNIILVWDRPRSKFNIGSIDIAEFLTPLSWSICAIQKHPDLRIAILDLYPHHHANDRVFNFYISLLPEKRPFVLLTIADFIPGLIRFAQESFKQAVPTNMLDIIAKHIRMLLTERSDESNVHAIANIIGPLALMGNRLSENSQIYSKPMLCLFESLGLIKIEPRRLEANGDSPEGPEHTLGIKAHPSQSDFSIDTRFPIRALLVDDQETRGWSEWVASMLISHRNICLESSANPNVLSNYLSEIISKPAFQNISCFNFRLNFPSMLKAQPHVGTTFAETILLLDLRLFSEKHIEDEAAWLEKTILPLCSRWIESTSAIAPEKSRSFFSSELERVAEWCRRPIKNSLAHLIALTLLPRLIALVDYSLPIVLFSNTSQRRIIDLLKSYKNIFTDFVKPQFLGLDNANIIAEAEHGFHTALEKAIAWVKVRRFCHRILDNAALTEARPLREACPQQEVFRYIELFIDESDWNKKNHVFNVGGCFAVFEDEASMDLARFKADTYDDELVRNGLRFFFDRNVGSTRTDTIKIKKNSPSLRSSIELVDKIHAPSIMGCLRLSVTQNELAYSDYLFDSLQADNRFHRALEGLIELFLCLSLPALFKKGCINKNISISIFPATRVVRIDDEDKRRKAMSWFGLKSSQDKFLFSFNRSDVYPIVTRIIETHNLLMDFHRLLAIQLPYKGEPISMPEYFYCPKCQTSISISKGDQIQEDGIMVLKVNGEEERISCICPRSAFRPDYRALHYFADDLLRHFPDTKESRYSAVVGNLINGEFDDILDDHLKKLIRSSRRLDQGDLAGSLALFYPISESAFAESAKYSPENGNKPPVSYWFIQQLAAKMIDLTAYDFAHLVSSIDNS